MITYAHKDCSSCQDMGAALKDLRLFGSWTEAVSGDGHAAYFKEDA